jgi:hypothetical protein
MNWKMASRKKEIIYALDPIIYSLTDELSAQIIFVFSKRNPDSIGSLHISDERDSNPFSYYYAPESVTWSEVVSNLTTVNSRRSVINSILDWVREGGGVEIIL